MATMQIELDFTPRMPEQARERIEAGMAQADENADIRWKRIFDDCLLAVARRLPELTSDDVLAEMQSLGHSPETHNLSAIGARLVAACELGILARTDRVTRSTIKGKHGNRHNIWRSLYCQG